MKRLAFLPWLVLLAACGDSVVGGACADGYEVCDGRCVPVGGCGIPSKDSATTDAAADTAPGEVGTDGAPGDGVGDGSDGSIDGGGDVVDDGASDGGSTETFPDDTGPLDTGPLDTGPGCDAGLLACGGVCVDPDIDPLNCGGCGNVCPTGLCNGGKCRGAKAGHVVAIGHDYESTSGAVAGKPLANATFLPSRNPVRLLVLTEFAETSAVDNVDAILDGAAKSSGRTFVQTIVVKASDFHDKLNIDAFDVALVLDQKKAPAGQLATTADTGKATYTSFTKAGGVLVVLDGGSGTGEMPAFLGAGGLLTVKGHTSTGGKSLDVVDPADAVGIDVLSPYLAPKGTVLFLWTTTPDALVRTVVAEPLSDGPVVLHRVIKP
ncbi:MAG: hypothetical protein IPJ34_06585 [Myxococcales bacterium]|nr:hypothetical protein [Myxococcales bacterium]